MLYFVVCSEGHFLIAFLLLRRPFLPRRLLYMSRLRGFLYNVLGKMSGIATSGMARFSRSFFILVEWHKWLNASDPTYTGCPARLPIQGCNHHATRLAQASTRP